MSDPASALARFIRWVMRDVTYLGVYSATVVGDHGDAVDLDPDDARMRGLGLSRVPKGAGLLGDTSVVSPGLRCLFGFVDGDPVKPIVRAWEYSKGSTTLRLDGGGAPVARVGDLVRVLTEPVMAVVGIAAGQTSNPSPPPPFIDVPPAGSPVPVVPLTLATVTIAEPVMGVISDGANRVTA